MLRCRELSRLPRASKPRSVNFRRTTPGHAGPLISWQAEAPAAGRLDPRHPTYHIPRQKLGKLMPIADTPAFTLRAFPKAVLYFPAEPFPDPPHTPARVRPGRHNMSLMMIVGKKAVHKHTSVRRAVVNKIRTAVGLIIARGATKGVDARGREVLEFTDVAEPGLALSEWTYVIIPRLEVYRMPWPILVDHLRNAMRKILEKALTLESLWQAQKGRPSKSKDAQVSILEPWVPDDTDAADAFGADLDPGTPSARQTALAKEVTKNLEATLGSGNVDFDTLVDGWLDESVSASAPSLLPKPSMPSPPPKPSIPSPAPKASMPSVQSASTTASMLFRKPIIRSPKSRTSTKRPR